MAGNADVDNLTESGDGEDSEEDEWNFIPGSGENKKEDKTEQVCFVTWLINVSCV